MFAAVLNRDRSPVDLDADVTSLHVQTVGRGGHVAFAWSKVGPFPAEGEKAGMASLADRYWIVGRIRLDARQALQARLATQIGGRDVSDALLCLHAYAQWGEGFVDFLAGDFSFALWDDDRGRLVCARDQLGVRSLFHASVGQSWFVSDSLEWIAVRPRIGRDLDECWIADFLTTGFCVDLGRTVYREIHRLAPAHVLAISGSDTAIRKYWRLEIAEPIYYRDSKLYGERFRELLSSAIADRLPAGRVGIAMSGGLDSTTLAALSVGATGDPSRVFAECFHFETLMPDEEKHFSSLVARQLGIDLRLRAVDAFTYDPQWRTRSIVLPEPSLTILNAHNDRRFAVDMAADASVWFYGEGPDNALTLERDAYLSWLVERRDWRRLAAALFQYVRVKGVGGWAKTVRRHARRQTSSLPSGDVPTWVDRGLAERVDLTERIRVGGDSREPRHPWHPKAMASFNGGIWQRVLGDLGSDEAHSPFVWRHPFLDLRVLEFMLSVPPVPWGWEKHLLREAMRGRLEPAVLERKKTPLAGSPIAQPIRDHGLPGLSRNHRLAEYVDVDKLPSGDLDEADLWKVIGVHALDHWLATHEP